MIGQHRGQATMAPAVLVVCHYYPPHVGGIEEVARAEAHGLAGAGVPVTVLTSSPGARRAGPGMDETGGGGIRVVRIPALNILQRFGVPFPLFFLPSLIYHGWIEVRRAGVVHVHDTLYLSSWVVAVCCRLQRTPLVVTKHVAVVAHPWPAVAWAQRIVYGTVGRFVCTTADTVFYVNTAIRQNLLGHGTAPGRLAALPNGVDLDAFTPVTSPAEHVDLRRRLDLPTDRPLVLFVGRLVHKKGYRRLVEAAEDQEAWIAVLVGDGDTVPCTPQVIPCGARDRATVRLLYQACDVFALPSQSEGFPLTVQEAMASGLPVVTTDDPGYDMHGLDPGLVTLLPADSPALGDALAALAADPGRRRQMSLYSRRFAEENFNWARHIATLRQTFERIIAEHGPAPAPTDPISERAAS